MTTALARFVVPGCMLLLTLVSGIWLSRAGKPLEPGIFTVHKLVALATVIITGVQTYGALAGAGTQAVLVALLVAVAGVLALFITGALMSMNRPGYRLLLTIHNLAPVAMAAAMALAIYLLRQDVIQTEEQVLTARALRGLAQVPGLGVHGVKDPDSPRFARKGGVIAFSMKGSMPNRVATELADRGGIGIRYGCHCAHVLVKRILNVGPRLARFQGVMLTLFPQINLPGVARVSLGIENTAEDVDTLLHVLDALAMQPKGEGIPKRELNDFIRAAVQRVYARPAEGT